MDCSRFLKPFHYSRLISSSDRFLDSFKELNEAGAIDLRIMDGVGIEKFAEYCLNTAQNFIDDMTDGRCWVDQVEVFEHEKNSAICKKG